MTSTLGELNETPKPIRDFKLSIRLNGTIRQALILLTLFF